MTATNLLTPEELIELTGAKTTRKQIETLTKNKISFVLRSDGKIRTTWAAVNAVLLQKTKAEEQEPDLSFLRTRNA